MSARKFYFFGVKPEKGDTQTRLHTGRSAWVFRNFLEMINPKINQMPCSVLVKCTVKVENLPY